MKEWPGRKLNTIAFYKCWIEKSAESTLYQSAYFDTIIFTYSSEKQKKDKDSRLLCK